MFNNKEMKKKKKVKDLLDRSTCCNYEVRYNGFVGLIDYGYTCNCCDRKCDTRKVELTVWR